MKRMVLAFAAMAATAAWGTEGGVALTVYNGGFACVREARELDLQEGENALRLTDMSGQLEADSVVLRETGAEPFGVDILEQRYVNEPLTEAIMLRQMEGRDVRFRVTGKDGETREETGKLLRAGTGGAGPIVEMPDGVRFSMPGQPVFDGVDASAYLKPSLEWLLRSDRAGKAPVEVSYLTGGLSWEATYNLVAPEEDGDEYAFSGWVSMRNDSGKDYPGAELKLIAGDVAKLSNWHAWGGATRRRMAMEPPDCSFAPEVEERSFDEFHLYTMPRPTTLKNGELKQIEFLRANGVRGERQYVYEPLRGFHGTYGDRSRVAGLNNEKKVAVRIVVSNSETNGLGMPLPRGKMRLYRRDAKDGRPEFTGESVIDHTPKDEPIRLDNGYAFDLAAERTQTDFSVGLCEATERFRIKIRNHKDTAVTVRAVEHLWRWSNWEITGESAPHEKTSSNCAEWALEVPANGETVLTYTVHYTWI